MCNNQKKKPNIIIMLVDDMGYSDIGCFGGEINTPNIDKIANDGIKFTTFYNIPRCSPSRASILTGLHSHQTGMGHLAVHFDENGYPSQLNRNCITIAELLKENDYKTYMSGKWHLDKEKFHVGDSWPMQRGFEEFYGIIAGGSNYFRPKTLTRGNENIDNEVGEDYYLTDAISDNAVKFIEEHVKHNIDKPFFQYVAYTAPHWPLQAREEDIQKYRGKFSKGWDELRKERYQRMIDMGIVKEEWKLTPRDAEVCPWDSIKDEATIAWQERRMETYAAQIEKMDEGIGKIVSALEKTGELNNTIIMFLSDNGGCAEELKENEQIPHVMPGAKDTFQSYGKHWANLSNTPYKLYKRYTHEGGIATPFIIHWPDGINKKNEIRHTPCHIVDIMATIVDITGFEYPKAYKGQSIYPMEGQSIMPIIENDTYDRGYLYWEHQGNMAVMDKKWKLVKEHNKPWELYDMENDRTEMHDLAEKYKDKVEIMSNEYDKWAKRAGVIPWGTFQKLKNQQTGF